MTAETIEAPEVTRLRVVSGDALAEKHTTWIAPGWLPRALTVLVGTEGIGKSLWWVRAVAHITTGTPDTAINLPARRPANVLLIITEDSWGEVRARLELAGADLERVKVLAETREDVAGVPIVPGPDESLIEDEAKRHSAALIVVDAWLDTVPSGIQVKDTQGGRKALAPWARIAEHADAAVLLVTHANRLATANLRDAMGATVALRQKARMVLVAATPRDETGAQVYVGPDKANTTRMQHAQVYPLEVHEVRARTSDDLGTTARLGSPSGGGATIQELYALWADRERQEQREAEKPSMATRVREWVRADAQDWPVVDGWHQCAAEDVKTRAEDTFARSAIRDNLAAQVKQLGGHAGPLEQGGPHFYRLRETSDSETSGSTPPQTERRSLGSLGSLSPHQPVISQQTSETSGISGLREKRETPGSLSRKSEIAPGGPW